MGRVRKIAALCLAFGLASGIAFSAMAQTLGSSCSNSGWLSLQPNQILYCDGGTWDLGQEITSSGSVGIGTASPSQILHIYGTGNVEPTVQSSNGQTAAWRYLGSSDTWQVGSGPGGNAKFSFFDENANAVRLSVNNAGNVGIGTTSPSVSLDLSQKTDAIALPVGTSAQRPGTPLNGEIRYNSTTPGIEGYYAGAWNVLGGGGGGTVTLGTSASSTSPQRSGDATTGFFSPATGVLEQRRVDRNVFVSTAAETLGFTTVLGNPLTVANAGTTAVADFTNNGSGANSFYIYPFTDGNTYLQHDGGVIFSAIGSVTPQLIISSGGSVGHRNYIAEHGDAHLRRNGYHTLADATEHISIKLYTDDFCGYRSELLSGGRRRGRDRLRRSEQDVCLRNLHNVMRLVIDNGDALELVLPTRPQSWSF